MRVVGCPYRLETIAQIEEVRRWMAERGVVEIDPAKEPFLRRKLEQLAPRPVRIAPWQAPGGAA
jgi:hypothetical protein